VAVLPGDRALRVVQRRELPGRAPPLRLKLEVPQARLIWQRALTAHNPRVTAAAAALPLRRRIRSRPRPAGAAEIDEAP